jgi:chitin disaccharide deacetylase
MNPVLRALGFSPRDRVVVVHADDIGMFPSTVPAIDDLMEFGLVTSASAMVPCPSFPDVVNWRQRKPELDLGVHLTLTSEWERYRWGPISTQSEASGLCDKHGYFHHNAPAVRRHARREAVGVEMRCQIDLAERSGLAPTHIDSHMYVAMCDEFVNDYLQIGCERRIPAFMTRAHGNSPGEQELFRHRAMEWENRAQPVFACLKVATRSGDVENQQGFVQQLFDHLPAGLSCVLLHPALDTPVIRHVTRDWQSRVADFEVFRQPSLRAHIRNLGIQLISYQPLRDAMRRQLDTCSR